jgi:hypothetical protein
VTSVTSLARALIGIDIEKEKPGTQPGLKTFTPKEEEKGESYP